MKKIITSLCVLIFQLSIFAQAPSKMSYQAIVRGATGELITTAPVGMRITILQGSPTGSIVYSETQNSLTNDNGLSTIVIGDGNVVSGNLSTINWANGPYFIKTETDPAGGTNYSISGTSQLMSVPFAMYAATSGTPGTQGPPGNDGLTTSVNNIQQVNGNITLSKTDIGLGNVDNTSDVDKPISTATQAALNQKANISSPSFSGTPTVPTASQGNSTTQIASTAFVTSAISTASTPDADATTKGKIALGGDLAGAGSTAEAPLISDNAITTSKILNANVTSSKIADLNIVTTKIADQNVTTAKIADDNVTTAKIANNNITTQKIADDAVTTIKIADDNITTAKILDGNVTTSKIADDNITTPKIADDAVTTVKIADDNITTAKILDGNVTTSKIANNNITTPKIADDAVTTVKIADDNITTAKILDGNVTTSKIANNNITTPKIADDAVTTVKIADDNITTAKILDGNVTTIKIADNSITTVKIADDNVTTSKILDANVTTSKIADDNITTPKIADDAVTTVKIANDNITTSKILDANVTSAKIADANITTAKIADDNITTVKIADANITTPKINDASITTPKIADASVTGIKIADLSVANNHIQDAAVTYSKIQDVSASDKILGRVTTGPGPIEEISTTGTGDVVRADSPSLTGTPVAPTAIVTDNSAQVATTAFTKSAIAASEIKETPSGYSLSLSSNEAGKIITTEWGGSPFFPDTLPNGFTCTIVNYSNYPFTSNTLNSAFFFTTNSGWNNGAGLTSFGIKSGGTVKVTVIDIGLIKGYFISGDIQ